MNSQIFIGFDTREAAAFAVTRSSVRRNLTAPLPVRGLVLAELQQAGLYTRPTEWRKSSLEGDVMWDVISEAPMATEFACSRFLVPALQRQGWALFMDCDMLVRKSMARLFESLDPKYAVYCVKHNYSPKTTYKMDGQVQLAYERKLWSSFCIFNCSHESNASLTPWLVNRTPGRDLHAFSWLKDDEIGEIGEEWNWIPGHSSTDIDPACVHFTEGGPWLHNYQNVPYAKEWLDELRYWAR